MMKIDGVTVSTTRKTLELKTCEGGDRFLHLPLSAVSKLQITGLLAKEIAVLI